MNEPHHVRIAIAVAVGVAAAPAEIALRCRGALAASETCVWSRAYLPLSWPLYFVIYGLVSYTLLSLAAPIIGKLRGRA